MIPRVLLSLSCDHVVEGVDVSVEEAMTPGAAWMVRARHPSACPECGSVLNVAGIHATTIWPDGTLGPEAWSVLILPVTGLTTPETFAEDVIRAHGEGVDHQLFKPSGS